MEQCLPCFPAKGTIISASYTQPLWNTINRREHLLMSKCFNCACPRCSDPTEFGSYLSCFNCAECGAKVLPKDPLNNDEDWRLVSMLSFFSSYILTF